MEKELKSYEGKINAKLQDSKLPSCKQENPSLQSPNWEKEIDSYIRKLEGKWHE